MVCVCTAVPLPTFATTTTTTTTISTSVMLIHLSRPVRQAGKKAGTTLQNKKLANSSSCTDTSEKKLRDSALGMFSSTAPELKFPGALSCTVCKSVPSFFVVSLSFSTTESNSPNSLNSLILITQILLLLSAIVCVCVLSCLWLLSSVCQCLCTPIGSCCFFSTGNGVKWC